MNTIPLIFTTSWASWGRCCGNGFKSHRLQVCGVPLVNGGAIAAEHDLFSRSDLPDAEGLG